MATVIKLVPMATTKKRHKGRKFDRKRKRSASHIRYTNEKRWLTNKARRVRKCSGEKAYEVYCNLHGFSL